MALFGNREEVVSVLAEIAERNRTLDEVISLIEEYKTNPYWGWTDLIEKIRKLKR